MSPASSARPKAPWHLWIVGIVAFLWNASGTYVIMMAQAGRLPDLTADEVAYYAAQPLWFVVATDIALLGAVAGAIALLLRSRIAIGLFALSLIAIFVTNTYDLSTGASRALASTGALVVTAIIAGIAVLELAYAVAMKRRGVLG
jgi:hypothetical protein